MQRSPRYIFTRIFVFLLLVTGLALAGCSEVIRFHGYVPADDELEQVIVGVDDQASVEAAIGRPTTSSIIRDTAWYYVGSRVRHYGPLAPKEVDRQVVVVSFAENGTVSNIERFGLERGRVVTLSRRVTETGVRDNTFIRQILKNFGRIDIGDALDG